MNTKKTCHQNDTSAILEAKDDDPLKQMIFKEYLETIEEENKEFKLKNPYLPNIEFHLLQAITDEALLKNIFFNLAYFYDTNYTGNKDFIHIPNFNTIVNNAIKYPILFVTQKKMENIIGATTIKIENNPSITNNPYFPTINENVLTIKNILTKFKALDNKEKRIKGIGNELFKICIKSANKINKSKKIRLICEVDCRNINCFNSIMKAVNELQNQNLNVKACITGYYEIKNSYGYLIEAPTFILEIILEGDETIMSNNNIELNYSNCNSINLLKELKGIIQDNTKELKKYKNNVNHKIIIYHEIEKINLKNVNLNIGDTAKGNNRISNFACLQYETTPQDLL